MNYPMYGSIPPQQISPMAPMSTIPQLPPPINYGNDSGGNIWVQGLTGAKSYLVAPGRSATLWDSEAQVIYLKSADMSGIPNIRILDYTFRDEPKQSEIPSNDMKYVSIEEFEALKKELSELKEQIRHTPKPDNRPKQNKGGGKL